MIHFFQSISGKLTLQMTSADPAECIQQITRRGVELENVRAESELTFSFQIKRIHLPVIQRYAEKHGATMKIRHKSGLYWSVLSAAKRPVLILGMLLILMLCWLLPGRILYVQVQGNDAVPTRQILEAAQASGIRFGASGREVRSEKMKNALLARIPQLQWAGVNTYGSLAVITVRERSEEEPSESPKCVSSIVADRDGVVISCTVIRGNGLVAPGQVVQSGQTLISGYTDCGLSIEATQAEGEIFARTTRQLAAKSLLTRMDRVAIQDQSTNYSLIIGKKRINFLKDSGICDGSCVKMYLKYVLTLPGGFQLPLTLVRETVTSYKLEPGQRTSAQVQTELSAFAQEYLRDIMIAGTIVQCSENFDNTDVCTLAGSYACEEMIGRRKIEEIGEYNGKTD